VVGLANRDLVPMIKLADRFGQANPDNLKKLVLILDY